MFDPSFFELIIICVVALLVLGPDRLPGAIKTLGLWIGRLRRSFNSIKREIEQEVGADEIRRQLRNEEIMEKFKNTKSQITESIDSVKSEAQSIKDDLSLKNELSGITDITGTDSKTVTDGDNPDFIDPIEKLATSDPAARVIKSNSDSNTADTKPAQETKTKSEPTSSTATPASTELEPSEKPED